MRSLLSTLFLALAAISLSSARAESIGRRPLLERSPGAGTRAESIGRRPLLERSPGAGAGAAEPQVVQEPDKTVYKKKTVIDFNDVTLEGELTKPEGSYVINRKKTKFGSLIKLRGDFLPELQRSVDNL
jgi:hypothetical protein